MAISPNVAANQAVKTYYEAITPSFLQPNKDNGALMTALKVAASVVTIFPMLAYILDIIASFFSSPKVEEPVVLTWGETFKDWAHTAKERLYPFSSYHKGKVEEFKAGKKDFMWNNKIYTAITTVTTGALGYLAFLTITKTGSAAYNWVFPAPTLTQQAASYITPWNGVKLSAFAAVAGGTAYGLNHRGIVQGKKAIATGVATAAVLAASGYYAFKA